MPGLGHDWYNISIHALTRRAALIWRHWKEFNGISIHALTRRAAKPKQPIVFPLAHFNPRSHEESGLKGLKSALSAFNFNPRSHEESGYRG